MKEYDYISSKKNQQIQFFNKLHLKKYRQKEQLFIVEGQREIEEALLQGFVLHTLFFTAQDVLFIQSLSQALQSHCLPVKDELLYFMTKRENTLSMVAIFEQRWATLPHHLPNNDAFWVALESPKKPDNVGAIVRTAEASGASGVILLDEYCDPYSPESIRASAGAIFTIPLIAMTSALLLDWKTQYHVQLVGTRLENGIDYREASYVAPTVLLMGTEYLGLSPMLQQSCDTLVYIPIRGRSNSLNVSVASGILLYEVANAKAKNPLSL